MARRLTAFEVCDLFLGDTDDEMEMEVVEEEIIDIDGTVVVERRGEDLNHLIDDNLLADQHIAYAREQEEEEDLEIGSNQQHPSSETTSNSSNNTPEDIPSSDAGDFDHEWCKNLRDFPRLPEFRATPGLKCVDKLPTNLEDCKPIDCYKLFIDDELIKKIKNETNLYASQVIDKVKKSNCSISSKSYISTWKPVKLHEVKNFLAIIAHMSLVKKPRLSDYWAKHIVLHSTFASQIMKRNRFLSILSMFHLNDNSSAVAKGEPGHDPIHKVRPLVDHLNSAFLTMYVPEQQISIGEAMCPWKGSLDFKVCMKDKPIKCGIKLYQLCESTSGYVYRFEVFCGMPGVSNKPYDVVQRLMEPLKSLGYCLYTDRYYSSVKLAEDLATTNTGFTGTVMRNRVGLPKDFIKRKFDKGEADFMRYKNTMLLRWNDKNDVLVLSTVHKPQMVMVKTHTIQRKKPTAVVDYNKHMGGGDRSDQMVSYSPFHRKTVKWWKKLAFHLMSLTMVQAHCLYQKVKQSVRKSGLSLEDFVISVANDLVDHPANDEYHPTGSVVPRPVNPDRLRFQGQHFLVPIKKRTCVVCSKRLIYEGHDPDYRNRRTPKSLWECDTCKTALCVYPCMKAYHTMEDYGRVDYQGEKSKKPKSKKRKTTE